MALISQDSIKCIPDCEEGYEANPETYTCDIICPENQLRDPTTNTCYSHCPSDQIYDPSTNACNCPEGQELNPDTGYCEDIPVISGCETAFALGQITFINAGLGSERWGWIIEIPLESMEGNTPIYAGAGYNDLSKGILVGTLHYLKLNNKRMKVRYELDQPYILQETHLYVDNSIPTTSAPSQYGFQNTDLSTSEDTYTVKVHTLQDIYLIGHGVSCTLE